MKVWFVGIATLFALGCAGRQPVVRIGCAFEPRGTPDVRVWSAAGDAAPAPMAPGSLHLLVRLGVPDGAPIAEATVSLHADTLARDVTVFLWSGNTGPDGRLSWDSVPPGTYGLLVRRVGYGGVRRPLRVRAGTSDTVEVHLRYEPAC